jgi:hypothetical protein
MVSCEMAIRDVISTMELCKPVCKCHMDREGVGVPHGVDL